MRVHPCKSEILSIVSEQGAFNLWIILLGVFLLGALVVVVLVLVAAIATLLVLLVVARRDGPYRYSENTIIFGFKDYLGLITYKVYRV